MDELTPEQLASLSPEQKLELVRKLNDQYKAEFGESLLPEESDSIGSIALRGAATVLDYARGLVAAGVVAPALEAVTGKEITKPGTFEKVLEGLQIAPSSADILEKIGVQEGGSFSNVLPDLYSETGDEFLKFKKGGMLDPTERGAAGFAIDIATDPATWLSGGLSQLAKSTGKGVKELTEQLAKETAKGSSDDLLKQISNKLMLAKGKDVAAKAASFTVDPMSSILKQAGKGVYKTAFLSPDVIAKERGARPLSELAWENDIWGRRSTMEDKFAQKAKESLDTRDAIYDAMGSSSARIDYDKAFAKAQKIAAEQRKAGNMEAAAAIEKMMSDPAESGTLLRVYGDNDWGRIAEIQKQSLSEKLPASAYEGVGLGKAKGAIQQARKSMAGGLKKELEKAAGVAVPGGDALLKKSNEDLRTLMSSQKARQLVARVEGRRPPLTQVEKYVMTGSAALSDAPLKGATFLAAKKIADMLQLPPSATGFGIGAKKLSEFRLPIAGGMPVVTPTLKQPFIEEERSKQSPWTLLGGGQ